MASNSPTATTLLRPCDGTPVETCTHFAAADISWTCAGRPATSVCQRPQLLAAGFLSRVLAREGESLALRLPHAALEATRQPVGGARGDALHRARGDSWWRRVLGLSVAEDAAGTAGELAAGCCGLDLRVLCAGVW
jgi:hypothetical protein